MGELLDEVRLVERRILAVWDDAPRVSVSDSQRHSAGARAPVQEQDGEPSVRPAGAHEDIPHSACGDGEGRCESVAVHGEQGLELIGRPGRAGALPLASSEVPVQRPRADDFVPV